MTSAAHPLDLAYNPRLSAIDVQASFAHWNEASARTRNTLRCELDVPYGAHPTERLDIFHPESRPQALLFFIHGGYWRMLDKKDNSFVANAINRLGATVVLPNYALCPAVRIDDIVMQMVRAAAWVHRHATRLRVRADRLYVAGHSAGGHLATMMLAARFDSFGSDLPVNVFQAGLSISGLYDLRHLAKAPFLRDDIRLTQSGALKVSPAFMEPATDAPLTTTLGALEPEGFHLQDALLAQRWEAVHQGTVEAPGHDHFTILSELDNPDTPTSRLLADVMALN
jgi:arylformamidase